MDQIGSAMEALALLRLDDVMHETTNSFTFDLAGVIHGHAATAAETRWWHPGYAGRVVR
jgi:hypothetical protein